MCQHEFIEFGEFKFRPQIQPFILIFPIFRKYDRIQNMDDYEYYSKMRSQYSHPLPPKKKPAKSNYTQWTNSLGHEDAEMLQERFQDTTSQSQQPVSEREALS